MQQLTPDRQTELKAPKPAVATSLLVWGLVRAPLLLVVVFLLRQDISALPIFDGDSMVLRVIDLLSVPVSRILLCLGIAVLIGALMLVALRLKPLTGYLILVGGTAVISVAVFAATGSPLRHTIIPILLAATNFLPEAFLRKRTGHRAMVIAVGVAEGLILRRYLTWLAGLAKLPEATLRHARLAGWVLAALLVSASMAVLVKGGRLVPLEQALRMPETASIIMFDDINGLVTDLGTRRLYATGHGLETVHTFSLDAPEAPPIVSKVDTGGAQGISFAPDRQELSLFNDATKQILVIDATSLELNHSIDAPQLATGDPWIAIDPISNTVALVSEVDVDDGVAFLLLDRDTGQALDTRDLDAGNLLKHPEQPWLYMSFFRRTPELMVYDMAAREITARVPAPPRLDRMILVDKASELLVTSPATSKILRYDAGTLEARGHLKGPFGVRTLAYDPQRELLFAGSFVTGQISVIDLRTSRRIGTIYLGPWLRSIELDPETATAYVSSNGTLYRWAYDQLR